jgi:hypothetical protein
MVTLLSVVGLERITPRYIYFSVCYTHRCSKEQVSRTNYVCSSIPHCVSILSVISNSNFASSVKRLLRHPVKFIRMPCLEELKLQTAVESGKQSNAPTSAMFPLRTSTTNDL